MKYESIIKALDMLCDALELGHSESSTEDLLMILARAFRRNAVNSMRDTLIQSRKQGLGYDLRGPMADSILKAHAWYSE